MDGANCSQYGWNVVDAAAANSQLAGVLAVPSVPVPVPRPNHESEVGEAAGEFNQPKASTA
jgi:hypothetical protein